MAKTPIYQWPTPDDTRPFRSGAADMRALGNAIDASLKSVADTAAAARLDFYEMSSGSTAVLTNAAWSLAGVGTVNGSRGTGIVQWGSNLGLKVTKAGRFLVCGFIEVAANATGRRGIGFTTNPGSPVAPSGRRIMINALATGVTPLLFTMPVTLAANDGIGLMVYQDSGATQNGTQAYLSVSEI